MKILKMLSVDKGHEDYYCYDCENWGFFCKC